VRTDAELIKFLGIKYKLPQFAKEEVDVKTFTDVNMRNLEIQLEELPSQLNIFGIQVAKAMRLSKKAETAYKIWLATKDKIIRRIKEKKAEKITESQLGNLIRSDPEYLEMKDKLYEAEENYEILKSVYWAIQKKSEVLIELSRQNSNDRKLKNSRSDN